MKNLEIYIDGQRLNFINREGFPLALTYSIESAENPSQVNGAHTKRTANFPADGETDGLFQEWSNTTRVNPDAANQLPARIDVNGVTVLSGVAQLDEVAAANAYHGRRGGEHKVGIFGNNATWFASLAEKLVRDLGLMPVHDLTDGEVSAHDNADPDADTYGYFAVRGPDWATPGQVVYTEFQPFLFIRPILQEAFRLIGYQFNSDFFDTDLGKRLILPVLFRPYPSNVTAQYVLFVLDVNNATAVNISTHTHITIAGLDEYYDPGANYDTGTGYYTTPISGYYIAGVQTSNLSYSHRVRINGVVQSAFTDPCEIGIGEQGRIFLEVGDQVDLGVLSNMTTAGFCFLYIRPDFSAFEAGTTVDLPKYGNPTWKVSDIVLGITHAFGLVWDTDYDAQTVRCEPRDRYRITSQTSFEDFTDEFFEGFYRITDRDTLTDRVDLSKDAAVAALNSGNEKYLLAWKSDSGDANTGDLEGDATFKVFDGRYTYPAGRFQKGETKSENPFFCKTVHIFDSAVAHSTSTVSPQLPLIQDNSYLQGNENTNNRPDFGPRLLYFAGRRDGFDGLLNLAGSAYDFPAAFVVNYNDTVGYDPSLSFGDELLADGTTTAVGLIQRFHLQRLKRLEIGKLFSEWIRWSELDVLNMDFRRKVLIGDALYLLQKVNGYRPLSDGSTETELLKDEIPAAADVDKISESGLIGYIVSPLSD